MSIFRIQKSVYVVITYPWPRSILDLVSRKCWVGGAVWGEVEVYVSLPELLLLDLDLGTNGCVDGCLHSEFSIVREGGWDRVWFGLVVGRDFLSTTCCSTLRMTELQKALCGSA